jgi:hypothetical protein
MLTGRCRLMPLTAGPLNRETGLDGHSPPMKKGRG